MLRPLSTTQPPASDILSEENMNWVKSQARDNGETFIS